MHRYTLTVAAIVIAASIIGASCSSPSVGLASPCTTDEDCLAGQWCDVDELICVGEPTPDVTGDGSGFPEGCTAVEDCWPHEDGNFCNGLLTCRDGRCVVDPNSVVVCPPSPPCEPKVCNPGSGYCETRPVDDCVLEACSVDADCPAFDVCLTPRCIGGLCSGTPVNCDDGDPCTDDVCDARGCQNVFTPEWPGCGAPPDPLDCEFAWQCAALETSDNDSACVYVDCIDGRCETVTSGGEEICNDGQDNNCDGWVDCADTACAQAAACGACGTNPIELSCNKWTSVQGLWGGSGIDKYACLDAPATGGEIAFKVELPYKTTVSLSGISEPYENAWLMTLPGDCTGEACTGAVRMTDIADNGVLNVPVEANTAYYFAIDQTDGQPTYFAEMFLECPEQELCQDFYDNDKDGLVDCNDPDCAATVPCEPSETKCQDGIDNDGDGLFDCDDTTCAGEPECKGPQKCATEPIAELTCGSVVEVNAQTSSATSMQNYPCAEGNFSGPEWVFSFTPATSTPLLVSTKSLSGAPLTTMALVAECQSAACAIAASDSEPLSIFAYGGTSIYLVVEGGPDDAFFLTVECGATPPQPELCGDGKDNDGDGAIDCADSDCVSVSPCQSFETQCVDGIDNDGDGATDCQELWCQQNSDSCDQACVPDAQIFCEALTTIVEPGPGEGALSEYACLPGSFPGGEIVFSYTAETTGKVSVVAFAEPFEQVWAMVFEDGCDAESPCLAANTGVEPLAFDAQKGSTYTVVLDSQVAQPVFALDVFVQCSKPEVCDDGADNDGDGDTDCADQDCQDAGPPCQASETFCDDGIDNDGDGWTDCADPSCGVLPACPPALCGSVAASLACGDAVNAVFGDLNGPMTIYNCSEEPLLGQEVVFDLGSGLSGYVVWQAKTELFTPSRALLLAGQCGADACQQVVFPGIQGELTLKFEADPSLNYWVVVDGGAQWLPFVEGASMECY